MKRFSRLAAVAAAIALTPLAPALARAQAPTAGISAGFESYRFTDPSQTGIQSVSLFTVPVAARVPLFLGSSLAVDGAYARGSLTLDDGSVVTLRGFTDTQVSLLLPVRRDAASLTAVAILPTGIDRLTEDQALLAGVVASDLLPFRISNWGAGGAGGLAATAEHAFGRIGVGASASYLVGRRYDLLNETGFGYRPGNQFRARVAFDASTGASGKASLQLTYLHSSDDQLDGANLYRPGDRFQAMASYAFGVGGRASGLLYTGVLQRASSSYLLAGSTQPQAQQLYLAGGGLRLPVGASILLPSLDVRVVRRSDGLDQGVVAGLGGSAQIPLAGRALLMPEARARFGHVLVSQGSATGFNGFDFGMGLRFGGAAR